MSTEVPSVSVNRDNIVLVVEAALKAREQEDSPLHTELPEKQFIDLIISYGEKIGDERFALNALFFVTSCVFSQNTSYFFNRITDEERLEKYAWLFQPEVVVARFEAGENIEAACEEFLRPAGHSKNAIKEWVHNSRVLHEKYGGDIRNFFEENENDAMRILKALVVAPRAKTASKPGLRRFGVKLSRLFIQWVTHYDLYKLDNADKIGLPIDYQITRLLLQTAGIILKGRTIVHTLTYKVVLPELKDLCAIYNWDPKLVSAALWLLGHRLCSRRRHKGCPVGNYCTSLVSREPYDRGVIYPEDIEKRGP
jgi:hypothetical protein